MQPGLWEEQERSLHKKAKERARAYHMISCATLGKPGQMIAIRLLLR